MLDIIRSHLMNPETLAGLLQEFLAESRVAVAVEDGAVVFDFSSARYSVSGEHGKCVLHLWSAERDAVRRVLDAESLKGVLRLRVQRFGKVKPGTLEICRERERRTPSAQKAARARYQQLLRRMLERNFPGFEIDRLSSAIDLKRSFGPVYTR